MNKQLHSVAIN